MAQQWVKKKKRPFSIPTCSLSSRTRAHSLSYIYIWDSPFQNWTHLLLEWASSVFYGRPGPTLRVSSSDYTGPLERRNITRKPMKEGPLPYHKNKRIFTHPKKKKLLPFLIKKKYLKRIKKIIKLRSFYRTSSKMAVSGGPDIKPGYSWFVVGCSIIAVGIYTIPSTNSVLKPFF